MGHYLWDIHDERMYAMFYYEIDNELQLRLLESKHAHALFELVDHNRLSLREWLPWVDATTSAEHVKDFIIACLQQFSNNKGFQCGIFYRGQLVGAIGFHVIDWANKKTSIGYWLATDFQGHGIMTRSCKALVHYAFQDMGLKRLEIKAGIHNLKSRAIPERLGFSLEGVLRQSQLLKDHYIDLAVYGMLEEEWK
jgi:ribosomal-protein-serine acetyltransferase